MQLVVRRGHPKSAAMAQEISRGRWGGAASSSSPVSASLVSRAPLVRIGPQPCLGSCADAPPEKSGGCQRSQVRSSIAASAIACPLVRPVLVFVANKRRARARCRKMWHSYLALHISSKTYIQHMANHSAARPR